MLDVLLERFRRHDRSALARLLTLVARGEAFDEVLLRLTADRPRKPSRVIAITGSGGVGKSTLVGRLIEYLRARSQTVAVLACDPQSPLTGGALLGDRFRMPSQPDDGLFIRSLAAAPGQGAVAAHLPEIIWLLELYDFFDIILVETVGAGQGETTARDLADVVVLLLQPEMGDDLQWEKAGVLEIADVVVIHKADLPGAERVESQVTSALGLSNQRAVPVVRVSSKTGAGFDRLWEAIAACPSRPDALSTGRDLLRHAHQQLDRRFAQVLASQDSILRRLLAGWNRGTLSRGEATEMLLRLLVTGWPGDGASAILYQEPTHDL